MPKKFRLFSTPPPTNQPLGVEAVGVQAGRRRRLTSPARCCRPVGPGVTAVDVGENVRSDEVANTSTGCPGRLHLRGADDARAMRRRIPDVALQAAERAVAEDAEHPRRAALPIITGTDGAEPAIAARPGVGADDASARRSAIHAAVRIPDAAAATAENVEASPARSNRHRAPEPWCRGEPPDRLPRPIRSMPPARSERSLTSSCPNSLSSKRLI